MLYSCTLLLHLYNSLENQILLQLLSSVPESYIYIRRYSNVTRAKKVSFFFHFQLTFVNDVIGSSSSKGGESEGTISTNSTKLVPIKQQNGIPNRKSKVRRTLITYAIKNSSIMS